MVLFYIFVVFVVFVVVVDIEYTDSTDSEVIEVQLSETFSKNCKIKGYPEPTYEWMRNRTIIRSDKYFEYKVMDSDEFGNYTCVATNSFGKLSYTLIIKNADAGLIGKDASSNRGTLIFFISITLISIFKLGFPKNKHIPRS